MLGVISSNLKMAILRSRSMVVRVNGLVRVGESNLSLRKKQIFHATFVDVT